MIENGCKDTGEESLNNSLEIETDINAQKYLISGLKKLVR